MRQRRVEGAVRRHHREVVPCGPHPAALHPPPLPPTRWARGARARLPWPARTHAARRRADIRRLHPPARLPADDQRRAGKPHPDAQLRRPALRMGTIRRRHAEPARLLIRARHDHLRQDQRRRGVDLQISGSSAAHGSLRRGAHKSLVGTLGGTHVGAIWQLPCGRARNCSYCRLRCAGELKRWLWTALLPAALLAGFSSSSAASSLSFIPCATATTFECTSLAVPLERSGAAPGTISPSVERKLAGVAPSPRRPSSRSPAAPGRRRCRCRNSSPRRSPPRSARATCSCSINAAPAPRSAQLRRVRNVQRQARQRGLPAVRQRDRDLPAPASPQRNPSKTSRRCARPAATKSSCCYGPPTAPGSRSTTPSAIPRTSKPWCSTRRFQQKDRNRSRYRASRRSPACSQSYARAMPAPGHLQSQSVRRRQPHRASCASTRSAARSTTGRASATRAP